MSLRLRMEVRMKKKRTAAIALGAVGVIAVLALGGRFTADTVQAAGEIAALTDNTVLQAAVDTEIKAVYKNMIYNDTGCTLMLPTGYVASEEMPRMYVSERNPVDSSNIYYTVSENINTGDLEAAMDSDEYKQVAEEKFQEAYGEEASITAYRMTKTETDGCPTYKLEMSCKAGDMQMDQLVYIIAADKVYTITYSQSADDDRMEDFKKSAETIQVVFDTQE